MAASLIFLVHKGVLSIGCSIILDMILVFFLFFFFFFFFSIF
jgi:hypothetical protein